MFISFCHISLTISILTISYNFYIINKKLNNLNKILNKILFKSNKNNKKNKKINLLKNINYLNNMLNESEYIIL